MRIAFVETEASEESFFSRCFAGHQLEFVRSTAAVSAQAEVVSVFIYWPIDAAFLESHPALRLVATRSTTTDHIDFAECARRGVTVSRIPSYGDYTVAEHAMMLILAVSRRLRQTLKSNRQTGFSYEAIRGSELRAKTLGIIGTGRIGLHLVPLAKAFGLEVIATDIAPQPEHAKALGFHYVSLETLLLRSQIISLHAALTVNSWHLLDGQSFARCRRGVLIINTARGGLIDTEALLAALESGIVGGVGLDVLEEESVLRAEAESIIANQIVEHMHASIGISETRVTHPRRIQELQALMRNNSLLARPEVLFTPHCAFNTVEAVDQINHTTVKNIRSFLIGKPSNVASGE